MTTLDKHHLEKLENLEKISLEHPKAMEQTASKVLKRKSDSGEPVELSQQHGKKLKVQLGKPEVSNDFQVKVDDLTDIQLKLHASETGTKDIASWINKIAGKRVVETNFQKKLIAKNKLLEDFYVVKKHIFTDSKGNLQEKWCCYVEDVSDIAFFVVDKRDFVIEDTVFVVGLDKGTGGWLKGQCCVFPMVGCWRFSDPRYF